MGPPARGGGPAGGEPAAGAAELFAVVAGGGTGGHAVPALALAEALARHGRPRSSIALVGGDRGMEAALWAGSGFPVVLLPGRGITRRLGLRATVDNLGAVAGLGRGLGRALALLRRHRPAVVVVAGGYASAACAAAGAVLATPLVVMEQNAVPGTVNRLVARRAAAAAVAFPGTDLPRARVTGTPLREAVASVARDPKARAAARQALGLPPGRGVVAVVGGSLGSSRLNRAARDAARAWAGRDDLVVHHVVGRRDWPGLGDEDLGPGYRSVAYEERMPELLCAADLFVSRAGGTTVAELAAAGVPSVLVPLPGAPGDHQRANAGVLASAGAAVVVEDADLDGTRMAAEVEALLGDAARLEAMGRAARGQGRPRAAEAVAEVVEGCARG